MNIELKFPIYNNLNANNTLPATSQIFWSVQYSESSQGIVERQEDSSWQTKLSSVDSLQVRGLALLKQSDVAAQVAEEKSYSVILINIWLPSEHWLNESQNSKEEQTFVQDEDAWQVLWPSATDSLQIGLSNTKSQSELNLQETKASNVGKMCFFTVPNLLLCKYCLQSSIQDLHNLAMQDMMTILRMCSPHCFQSPYILGCQLSRNNQK